MAEPSNNAAEGPSAKTIIFRHTLRHPIAAYGDEVKEITLREPTGADIIATGVPVIFDPLSSPPKIDFDMLKMTEMLARLAAIPTSSFRTMDPRDLMTLAWGCSGFFLPEPGKL